MKRGVTCALAAGTLALALGAAQAATPPADLVFLNGKVFTADGKGSVQQAMAVRGDRFVAVGSNGAVRKHIGPQSRVIDLHGRFVSPGLADAHFHNEGGGDGVDLSKVRSMSELLGAVKAAADTAPEGAIIISNADWHEAQLSEQRLPTAADLDQASADRPVVLVRGGHSYILNSAALRKWNVSKETQIPAGGAIPQDKAGELTGELIDAAKAFVTLPPPAPVTRADVLATQKALNAYGVTAVRVPGFYKGDPLKAYSLLKAADAAGELSLRYVFYLPGFGLRSAPEVGPFLERWGVKPDEGGDWLRIGGVKLGVDGGFEGGHMSSPYAEPYGNGGTFFGIQTLAPEPYKAVVMELNRLGWRPTTHAVGDAGLDVVLDAYAAADRDRPIAGKRWSIEHAFVVRPEQVDQLKRLDVAVSVQDHLYLAAPVLEKYWGRERAEQVTPLKLLAEADLLLAGGTDAPVIPYNPFWELYHFLTRDTISGGVFGPRQGLASRKALLELVTINYARMIGEQASKGSIEPGKLADFAVLTDDFLTAPPARIRDMKALATYVGGKEVYRSPDF